MIQLGPVKTTIVNLNNEPNTSQSKTITISVHPGTKNNYEPTLRTQISGNNWKTMSKKGLPNTNKPILYAIYCGLYNVQPQSKSILLATFSLHWHVYVFFNVNR